MVGHAVKSVKCAIADSRADSTAITNARLFGVLIRSLPATANATGLIKYVSYSWL